MTADGLNLRGVRIERGGRPVIERLDARVPAGTLTAVTGRSGAGKSTLLRACNGLLAIQAGSIALDGTDCREIEPTRLRRLVGLVAQTPVMLPGTVADNLAHGEPHADIGEGLRLAGLDPEFADRAAAELSGGEQARVAIARALTRGPRVLLLDEATAPLDRATALRLAGTLRELADRGLAIAVATHDLAYADEICDHELSLDGPG